MNRKKETDPTDVTTAETAISTLQTLTSNLAERVDVTERQLDVGERRLDEILGRLDALERASVTPLTTTEISALDRKIQEIFESHAVARKQLKERVKVLEEKMK